MPLISSLPFRKSPSLGSVDQIKGHRPTKGVIGQGLAALPCMDFTKPLWERVHYGRGFA
jgi:hypothetical protein